MTVVITIHPKEAQEIYEIVASHRTKTRGTEIKMTIDHQANATKIVDYSAIVMEPNEIKKKGIGLTSG